jgi:hypothetical protein
MGLKIISKRQEQNVNVSGRDLKPFRQVSGDVSTEELNLRASEEVPPGLLSVSVTYFVQGRVYHFLKGFPRYCSRYR